MGLDAAAPFDSASDSGDGVFAPDASSPPGVVVDASLLPDACSDPVTHSDGEGDSFLACAPLGAYSPDLAILACRAYQASHPDITVTCTYGDCGSTYFALFDEPTCDPSLPIWIYDSPLAGKVTTCNACSTPIASWE